MKEEGKHLPVAEQTDAQLMKAKRLYHFISQINQMIVRSSDATTVFKEACKIATTIGKFKMAWIGLLDEQTKMLVPVIHDGIDLNYLADLKISSDENLPEGRGPSGTALREGRYISCNDIENTEEMGPWKAKAVARNYLSSISLPIRKSGKVIGAFTLYADTKNFFNLEEITLLEEATGDISFILDVFEKDDLRKKAEQAVLESERRYQTLTEISPVGIFHTDANGYTTYVNPRWCQISGLSKEAALGNGWLQAVHEEDRALLKKGWTEATKNNIVSLSEYRFIKPDGSIVWVMGQAIPETNEQQEIIGYVGTTTDITERKQAEMQIARLYKEKQMVLNRISDGMVSLDNEWRYTFLNEAALATHPMPREEIIGKTIWEIHPELVDTVFDQKYRAALQTKEVQEVEAYYAPMKIWFSAKAYPSDNGLTIFYSDITERKKTELSIIKLNEQLSLSQKIGHIGYWELDLVHQSNFWSEELYRLYGLPNNGTVLSLEEYMQKVHPEDREQLMQKHTRSIQSKQPLNAEFRFIRERGVIRNFQTVADVITDESGKAIRLAGTTQDITERKKIETAILHEQQLSDSIINSLPGIFYLYNREGKFIRWNHNFETVSGYSSKQISKMHPLDFFTPEEKELLATKITDTFIYGEQNVQANFLLKTGETIPYYFTGTAIEYEGSMYLVGVGIDFSERVRIQEEVRKTSQQLQELTTHLQSIREEERKRIGREIHDELGQQLTAIKMDIAWINKKTTDENKIVKDKLTNVIQLLDGSNLAIRRILNELRPAILDEHGLLDALQWHNRQFRDATGIAVELKTDQADIKVNEQTATCIFRVYQEALTNIMRYAHANKVLTSLQIEKDRIEVTIEDDGKGFDVNTMQSAKSFGLLGMRERIRALNGQFTIFSQPGEGTRIQFSLPISTQTNR